MGKLKTETNTKAVEEQVRRSAREELKIAPKDLRTFFEHGQWWVEQFSTGAQWSVCDATPGPFCFEQVTQGQD